MKKKLVASLAAAMVLGLAGTSFAATNPFTDVPAKHWSYDAVTKLANAGIVDGYGDGTFKGDKVITRYEMAQIVAKAMAHSDKATAEQKASIDKLAVEFASELEGLNVRVTSLENKTDNVKWGGEIRERYDSIKQDGRERTTGPSQSYVDMWATTQINPDWVGKVEYESSKHLTNSTNADGSITKAGDDGTEANTTRVYVQGALFGGKATIGKFNPFSMYGLVIDDNMTGIQYEFGNVVKARVGYGKYAGGIDNGLPASNSFAFTTSPTYAFGEFDYAASKTTNVKVAYHSLSKISATDAATDKLGQDSIHYIEAGFDTKLAKDWSLMGTYAKSNLDTLGDNKGYLTQVTYKAADIKKAGSYDIYANYRKIPLASQMDSTWDYARGIKGPQLGFDYIPATNVKVNAFYLDGKNIASTTGTDVNAKVYRAQVEFFF
jgi:hypothetical protein